MFPFGFFHILIKVLLMMLLTNLSIFINDPCYISVQTYPSQSAQMSIVNGLTFMLGCPLILIIKMLMSIHVDSLILIKPVKQNSWGGETISSRWHSCRCMRCCTLWIFRPWWLVEVSSYYCSWCTEWYTRSDLYRRCWNCSWCAGCCTHPALRHWWWHCSDVHS